MRSLVQSELSRATYFWLMQEEHDRWVAAGRPEIALTKADSDRRDDAIGADEFRARLEECGFAFTGKKEDFSSRRKIRDVLKKHDYKYDDKSLRSELLKPELGLTDSERHAGGKHLRGVEPPEDDT